MTSSLPDPNLCFECNRPKEDHPLVTLTQGISTPDAYRLDGQMVADNEGVRIILAGRSWKYEMTCENFVG